MSELIIASGVVLMIAGFVLARRHHVNALQDSDWKGTTHESVVDKVAVWFDTLGMLLILRGLIVALLRWLHWL